MKSSTILVLLALISAVSQAQQAAGLKTAKNPGGGEFVYGVLDREAGSTKKDAMRFMLRMVHGHFGDTPQLGKFFQTKDGASLGTFFTLKDVNHGGQPLAGLAIVYFPGSAAPHAAVLYDSVKRFPTTAPSMLRALSKSWSAESPASAASVRLAPLVWVTGGDRTAFIKLPEDWWLTAISHGMLTAEGPHGEQLAVGAGFQNIVDPRMPGAQRQLAFFRSMGGADYFYCPLSRDLFSAFTTLVNQNRSRKRLPAATYQLVSAENVAKQGPTVVPSIVVNYTADYHDGAGLRKGLVVLDAWYQQGAPTWSLYFRGHSIPQRYEQAEWPRMTEIARSYTQDTALMQRQTEVRLRDIHRVEEQSLERTRQLQQDTANLRRQMNESHNDVENWMSKLTENYQRDNSVVRDLGDNWHIHTDDRTADELVRANPGVFEHCPNMDLRPGVDY